MDVIFYEPSIDKFRYSLYGDTVTLEMLHFAYLYGKQYWSKKKISACHLMEKNNNTYNRLSPHINLSA